MMEPRFDVPGLKPEAGGAGRGAGARRITGDNGRHVVSYGTEAGQFQERGYSAVVCGPGDIAQAHQPNEYITVAQFRRGERFVARVVESLCDLRGALTPAAAWRPGVFDDGSGGLRLRRRRHCPRGPEERHMPVKNRFAELMPEITAWRRDLHEHPELLFDTHRTAGVVAREAAGLRLRRGGGGDRPDRRRGRHQGQDGRSGRVVGLRADMDALPIDRDDGRRLRLEDAGRDACLRA